MAEYHVENFGCRTSRADGESIAAALRTAGWREASSLSGASLVVLNTCSVTAEAEREARAYLRRVKRVTPAARVVFTGCYAQRAPGEIAALEGVDAVVGNSHKSLVAQVGLWAGSRPRVSSFVPLEAIGVAEQAGAAVSVWHDPSFGHSELAALPFAAGAHQTRPNLKVQDGCANRCSFCIIPVTRGPSRSVSLADSLRAVEDFVASGGKEMVLSGINLGRWGRDLTPVRRLEDLVAAVLEQTQLPRLRISSVEPMDWSPGLLRLMQLYGDDGRAGPRFARHAHLPLQSGSDAILRAMHRRYRPWHYAEKVEKIHAAQPDAAIGADVMIGFPGETDDLFRETYDFIERLPFTYLHLFPFSARPGTAASVIHQSTPVCGEAVQERKLALSALIARKNETFRRRLVGLELTAVTIVGGGTGRAAALADNFVKVSIVGGLSGESIAPVAGEWTDDRRSHRRSVLEA